MKLFLLYFLINFLWQKIFLTYLQLVTDQVPETLVSAFGNSGSRNNTCVESHSNFLTIFKLDLPWWINMCMFTLMSRHFLYYYHIHIRYSLKTITNRHLKLTSWNNTTKDLSYLLMHDCTLRQNENYYSLKIKIS